MHGYRQPSLGRAAQAQSRLSAHTSTARASSVGGSWVCQRRRLSLVPAAHGLEANAGTASSHTPSNGSGEWIRPNRQATYSSMDGYLPITRTYLHPNHQRPCTYNTVPIQACIRSCPSRLRVCWPRPTELLSSPPQKNHAAESAPWLGYKPLEPFSPQSAQLLLRPNALHKLAHRLK